MEKSVPTLVLAQTMTIPSIAGCYLKMNVVARKKSIGREKIVTFLIDTIQKI